MPSRAEKVVSVPLEGFETRFGAPYALIHRADLLDALLETCRHSPLIRLETSRQVTDFHDDGAMVRITNNRWSRIRRHPR